MEMKNLRRLHDSMLAVDILHQQFPYRIREVSFDCLFSIRQSPNMLALTARGDRPNFFRFDVGETFEAPRKFLEEDFKVLASLLRTTGASGNKLIPFEFFAEFDAHVPVVASPGHMPTPAELIALRPDIREHRDLPYFDTWVYWPGEHNGPTAENRAKTLAIIGSEALNHSEKFRASTRWSATLTSRDWKQERKKGVPTQHPINRGFAPDVN